MVRDVDGGRLTHMQIKHDTCMHSGRNDMLKISLKWRIFCACPSSRYQAVFLRVCNWPACKANISVHGLVAQDATYIYCTILVCRTD